MAVRRVSTLSMHLKTLCNLTSDASVPRVSKPERVLSPFSCRGYSTERSSYRVEVNGVNFHYERAGSGAHPVLLLPGALGSSQTDFSPQLDGLNRDKYTVIAFDPRGYGKSRPPDRDWPLLFFHRDAEDAAALMQKLGFPNYSVLGWSDGGITGIVLTAAFPGNVKKLLIWGANASCTEEDLSLLKAIEDIDKWSDKMRSSFLAVYDEEYFRRVWKQWTSAMFRFGLERNGDICIDSLPNIKCKTLIVNGHKDALVPQRHPHYLQKHIPNCRTVEWPEGKHNLHLRYHQEFNRVAEEFLDESDQLTAV